MGAGEANRQYLEQNSLLDHEVEYSAGGVANQTNELTPATSFPSHLLANGHPRVGVLYCYPSSPCF
jgi:hypothetical protein